MQLNFLVEKKFDIFFVLLLFFTGCFTLFSLPIQGNFPLNDDDTYYSAVKNFFENGKYFPERHYMLLLPQIFLGAFFSSFFELNFVNLRILNLLVSVISICLIYFLFKDFELDEITSFMASLLVFFNPLFFSLTVTFMTDNIFFFLFFLSLIFLMKWGKKREKPQLLFIGLTFAIISFLQRQYGIFLILGAFLYSFCPQKRKFNSPDLIKKIKIVLTNNPYEKLLILLFLLLSAYVLIWSLPSYNFSDQNSGLNLALGLKSLARAYGFLLYLSFFAFPLLLILLFNQKIQVLLWQKKTLIVTFLALIGFFAGVYLYGKIMPFFPNIIHSHGIGPKFIFGEPTSILPPEFWILMAIFSIAAMAIFSSLFSLKSIKNKLSLFVYGIFFCFFLVAGYFIDRQMLPFIHLFLGVLIFGIKLHGVDLGLIKKGLIFSIIFFSVFSYVFTYEYLSWNNARWEVIKELSGQGISPNNINGGLEYCNFVIGINSENPLTQSEYKKTACGGNYSENSYVISFKESSGFKKTLEKDYFGPFGVKMGTIYALKKT